MATSTKQKHIILKEIKSKNIDQHVSDEMVKQYNCPGCTLGGNVKCGEYVPSYRGCRKHSPGSMLSFGGPLILIMQGLPTGFDRRFFNPAVAKDANFDWVKVDIYTSVEAMVANEPNMGTIYNVAAWKYLDENNNTIIRFFAPRIAFGYSVVIAGDCRDQFPLALEITREIIDEMN